MNITEKVAAAVELTKPRALVMIVFTTSICYLIAATDQVDWLNLALTTVGVLFAAGGSLALNQYMERELDAKMVRTQTRPIPSGRISSGAALWIGLITMIGGYVFLWFAVNPACSIATIICGVFYNFLYTPMKLSSSFSSFVGAVPGGMLPIMGWTAARGKLEIGAWILFVILFLWQIPHALIISIRHRNDYESVGMKQLPIISNHLTSRRQMVFNVLILAPVSILPVFMNMTEGTYPLVALLLGFLLFVQMTRYVLNDTPSTSKWAFISLTAYLPLLLIAMYMDKPA